MPGPRNKATGEWRKTDERTVTYDGQRLGLVVIEQADMLDTKLNQTYEGGAYRVRIVATAGDKPRGKTFLGESAWNDSARYADDCINQIARSVR